jgi:hypothetical protein
LRGREPPSFSDQYARPPHGSSDDESGLLHDGPASTTPASGVPESGVPESGSPESIGVPESSGMPESTGLKPPEQATANNDMTATARNTMGLPSRPRAK